MTFNVGRDGRIALWSPYARTTTIGEMRASENLPMPTGRELRLEKIPRTRGTSEELKSFFDKYRTTSNNVGLFRLVKTDEGKIGLKWYKANENNIQLLGDFLRDMEYITKPNDPTALSEILAFGHQGTGDESSDFTTQDVSNSLDDIYQDMIDVTNRHNLYLESLPKYKLDEVTNNMMISSILKVGNDPVNLLQAQSPIDSVVESLSNSVESDAAAIRDLRNRALADFTNSLDAFADNRVSKDSVGISAVGMKTASVIAEFYNSVLNSGDSEAQEKLLTNKARIGDKVYQLPANVRAIDPNKITNEKVLAYLAKCSDMDDMALTLSAILSLATDNAKKLMLTRLNASPKMLGMYLYGTMQGISFKDLASILMSRTARILNARMEGNLFTETSEYTRALKAMEIFNHIPDRTLAKYRTKNVKLINKAKPVALTEILSDKLSGGRGISLGKMLLPQEYDKMLYTLQKLREFKNDDTILNSFANERDKSRWKYLVNDCISYMNDMLDVDLNVVEKLKTLAAGAEEIYNLGRALGINQAIKTGEYDFINQIKSLEGIVTNEDGTPKYDLKDLAFDTRARQMAAEDYENDGKHSVNIVAAITSTPHYVAYMQALATALQAHEQSFRFRSTRKLATEMDIQSQRGIKGLSTYINDYMINQFLRSADIGITIPKGAEYFDATGTRQTAQDQMRIPLGYAEGNATFKYYMDNVIVPRLKGGRVNEADESKTSPDLPKNKFLCKLQKVVINRTVMGNDASVWTSMDNMMPETDAEYNILQELQSGLTELASFSYTFSDGSKMSLPDLFSLYTLTAFGNQLHQSSLVPALEHFQNYGILQAFHNYEAGLDKSGKTLSLSGKDMVANANTIYPYIAVKARPGSTPADCVIYKNNVTGRFELYQKVRKGGAIPMEFQDYYEEDFLDYNPEEDFVEGSDAEITYPGYERRTGSDYEYFLRSLPQRNDQTLKFNGKEVKYEKEKILEGDHTIAYTQDPFTNSIFNIRVTKVSEDVEKKLKKRGETIETLNNYLKQHCKSSVLVRNSLNEGRTIEVNEEEINNTIDQYFNDECR